MKKILFHGNCHSCVVANWFQTYYSHKYQIIHCTEVGLAPFWNKSSAFCLWTPQNTAILKRNPKTTILKIHEKVKEADVFVFMHHTTTFKDVNTITLHNNFAKGLKICLPNNRFQAYPVCQYTLIPYIKHIYENITKNPIEILKYLRNVDDTAFTELLCNQYPFPGYITRRASRNIDNHVKHSALYTNVVYINDFVEKTWMNNLLFTSHNHPTWLYYETLISRLLMLLEEELPFTVHPVVFPVGWSVGKKAIVDPNEFHFFKNHVPNLLIPNLNVNTTKNVLSVISKAYPRKTAKFQRL